ncbi:uncharacterized protein N7515_005052 [Penicillium bovifimosum]|uniref:Fucose-specific lectin n=1 Tax=Penicillium bovifimosum TaxID=126998 RepID=A0A9W9H1A5_9EURO|nr:uncharacterized protein N7515_005052 [Penicillium bovifimosum]KAJ5135774.1 hypothetical protein N7515_005052 [Penicillium bovifimosum]
MPAFAKESDIACSAWGADSDRLLLYGQSDNGEILEYKYDDGRFKFLGVVTKARAASPIAVASNNKNWIRVYFLDEGRHVVEAANKGSGWELSTWGVTLHAASRLAARNDDHGIRVFGQAENGNFIEITRKGSTTSWKVISKRSVPGTSIAVPQNGIDRLFFLEVPEKHEHDDLFPDMKNDLLVKGSSIVTNWLTNQLHKVPDVELAQYRLDGEGTSWVKIDSWLSAVPNMQLAITDIGSQMEIMRTRNGKVHESWYKGGWHHNGFESKISDGPIAIVTWRDHRFAVFWHDVDDPTKINWAEARTDGWRAREAFN